MGFAEDLASSLRAGYPLIAAITWEEERVEAAMISLAAAMKRTLKVWSGSKGVVPGSPGLSLVAALEAALADPGPSLWLFKDPHPFLGEPAVVRALRDLVSDPKASAHPVVLVAPSLSVPRELEKDLAVLEVALPSAQDLEKIVRDLLAALPAGSPAPAAAESAGIASLANAARGLTLREAKRAFRRAFEPANVQQGGLVAAVIGEKRKLLRNTRFLEYYDPAGAASDLGGLGELRRWLDSRGAAFGAEARAYGLPQPKGVFLLGVQGCGKSLAAKAAAEMWGLPLLRFDAGAVVDGGGLGAASNLRQALSIAEALSPSVLWVDEIEKVFAVGAASSDGATSRVLGSFVTWLQEKTAPVFVVATANRVDSLPPELLRKGRFDEIFFVDLPGLHDRHEILSIHVRKRGRKPEQMDLKAAAKATEKFSGAELEAAVVSAMFAAFSEKREPTGRDLTQAVNDTVPLAITMEEDVRALKDWAKSRTRAAALDTRRADLFGEGK